MNNLENEQVEVEMINNQWIAKYEALIRLERSPDFKVLITDGYFKERAIDAVSLLAREDIKRQGLRTDVMEQLVAISNLQDFFITVKNLGGNAKAALEESFEDEE